MTLVPLLMEFAEDLADMERELFEDDFGFGIYPHELGRTRRAPRLQLLAQPRRRLAPYAIARKGPSAVAAAGTGKSEREFATVGKDGFQVCMDVQQFKPNELTVKTVENSVIVEGKHEEREDEHGLITRHFVRKYTLPKGYDPKDVVSTLSSDGVLSVRAPPPPKGEEPKERVVQIQQTGPAHLTVKTNPKEAVENGEKNNEKMED